MASLLDALLGNESGGQNIANTTQSTSSGQAQGYFQITTGTWNDFGGQKYAPNPLGATYAEQADIASKIPLKRWDSSTLAAMRATGKPIDPNLTLGQNLAMNGESFNRQMPLSDYLSGKTGNSLGASSPEQAADQANAARGSGTGSGDGYMSFGDIFNSIFGAIRGASNAGMGAANAPTYGTGENAPGASPGTSSLSQLTTSISNLFTADFWRNAAALIAVLIFAVAFMVFGGYRLINAK